MRRFPGRFSRRRRDPEGVFIWLATIGWLALFITMLVTFPKPRCNQVKPLIIGNALVLGGCR